MHEVDCLRREDNDTLATNTLLQRFLLRDKQQSGLKHRPTLMESFKSRVRGVEGGGKPLLKAKPVATSGVKDAQPKKSLVATSGVGDAQPKRSPVATSGVEDAHPKRSPVATSGVGDAQPKRSPVATSGVGDAQTKRSPVATSGVEDAQPKRSPVATSGVEDAQPKRVSVHHEALGKFLQDLCDSEGGGGRLEERVEDKGDGTISAGQGGKLDEGGGKERKIPKATEEIKNRIDLGRRKDSENIFKKEFGAENVKVKLIPDDKDRTIHAMGKKKILIENPRQSGVPKDDLLLNKDSATSVDKEVMPGRKPVKSDEEPRRPRETAHRKVSFKVTKTMGSRRKPVECRVVLTSSVGHLATRFNALVGDTTPRDMKVIVSRRNSTKRDPSSAGVKKPEDVCIFNEKRSNISITYRPSVLRTRPASVKAAIQMFELNAVDTNKAGSKEVKDSGNPPGIKKPFHKEDKISVSSVGSRKVSIREKDVKNSNAYKKISMIREGKEEDSKDSRRVLRLGDEKVQQNSWRIKKTSSLRDTKCNEDSRKSRKTVLGTDKNLGSLQAKGGSVPEVQRDARERLGRSDVGETIYSAVVDGSKPTIAVKKDKSMFVNGLKSEPVESPKSVRSIKGSRKDCEGGVNPAGSGVDSETRREDSGDKVRSTVSKSDTSDNSVVPSSLTNEGEIGAGIQPYEIIKCAQVKTERPKTDYVKPVDSIKDSKSDGVGVNRSGSGVRYGGIKVLPNKSSLFSLVESKDVPPRGLASDASLSGKPGSQGGSAESVNGHLNKNLERESNKGKQLDDGIYEEVGIYQKTKTTVNKISGLAKMMMSFPKSATKDTKLETKVDQKTDQKSVSSCGSAEVIKPNTSFLWGSVDSAPKLPNLPDIELTSDQEDEYDDVYPPEFYGYPDDENIYDDVGNLIDEQQRTEDGSLRPPSNDDNTPLGYEYVSSRNSYRESNNIYDDVKSLKCDTRSIKEDAISVSNCYESIYDGDGGNKEAVKYGSIYGGDGSKGDGSSASTKSFCELNNSLYGGVGPGFNSSSLSQASTASVEELAQFEMIPTSDCSATSDEWMDLEVSDCEMEAGTLNVVVHDRARCGRSPSWAQRVRRQWTSSTTTRTLPSGGDSSESDTNHHYEMLFEVGPTSEDIPFDDFDSDNSDELRPTPPPPLGGYNANLPQPPAAQYGISKMAEAAGNQLMKIRKSLSRMRQKRHTTEIRLTPPPSLPPSALPPLPPLPPPTLQKSTSTRNLPNRKYWSLRKFRRSTSAGMETSTFYLTDSIDADTGAITSPSGRKDSGSPAASESSASPGLDHAVSGSKSSLSSIASDRRGSVRPHSPPPLPPMDPPKRPQRKDKRGGDVTSTTSWYAECGLFDVNGGSEARRSCSNTLYADVGLWDRNQSQSQPDVSQPSQPEENQPSLPNMSLTSVSSVSETEGVSDCVERRFTDEPLYQFYTASVVELARRGMTGELDSDGYEEVPEDKVHYSRPTAMDLISPVGQHRTLWCEIPEVISSRVMDTLTTHQKKLQEAKFEIISSEASYVKSLTVLEQHFMASPEFNDDTVLCKSERRILFGNVAPVKSVSQRFLADLEQCWQDNVLLSDICDVVYQHATHNFQPYVKYCSNQIYLDRTLRKLKEQHSRFAEVLSQLEAAPICQSLSLHSFLMLPMQRVTRLPLLVDAMLTRLAQGDEEYHSCTLALARLNKVVKACNEGARKMERMEEILILSHQLEFPLEVKAIPIISSSRWLVRSGEVTQLVWRGDGEGKLTFGKKFSKTMLHVFLFTDLLIVTKKKSDDCYCVVDYCQRNLVQLSTMDGLTHLPVKFLADGGKNIMLLTLLHNYEKKTVEMVLSCGAESDRQRWMQAVQQPMAANPEESVYEHWDCPQVATLHQFVASQPDELALDVADVVNVLRKTPDGWYYGQRIRDGEVGWFPGNYATEIASAHVRAKNLKLRYRLLALSGNFLDSQRKDKK